MKYIPCILLLFLILLFLFPSPAFAQTWDEWISSSHSSSRKNASKTIDKTARYLCKKFAKKAQKKGESLAVSHFVTLNNKVTILGRLLSEKLIEHFSEGEAWTPVERDFIFKLTDEMKLGMSGMVQDQSVQKAGKLLGAPYMLVGTIENLEGEILVNARLVQTESGRILQSVHKTFKSDADIERLFAQELELTQSSKENEQEPAAQQDLPRTSAPPMRIFRPHAPETFVETRDIPQQSSSPNPKTILMIRQETDPDPDPHRKRLSGPDLLRQQREEYFQKRRQDLREVDRMNAEINREAAQKAAEREQRIDKIAEESWKARQQERQKEIDQLNKERIILLEHRRPHLHHRPGRILPPSHQDQPSPTEPTPR
jgi:TolB-like protein